MKDDFIDALRYSMGLEPFQVELLDALRRNKPRLFIEKSRGYQKEFWGWDMARQAKGKTMLDTSKKYKVGSVVYEWTEMTISHWVSGNDSKSIYPKAMQQLYDDGLAVEVKEPFEKTFRVKFNRHIGSSEGPDRLFDLVREIVGKDYCDTASVANRTFDVTIKERL